MHLFHRKGPIRPLPAGIPIDGTNYSEIREAILRINPLIDEQQTHINRCTGTFADLDQRQLRIHQGLVYTIAPEAAIGATESWLMELNDVRCAMELKGIILQRLKDENSEKITEEYEWQHWKGYLENYTYLQYLLNRLLKEFADYEHGKWYWIEKGLPILEPPFPAGAVAASNVAAAAVDPEKAGEEEEEAGDKKTKHVHFEKRIQGWYFNEDDTPLSTGKGEDKKARKEAEFHDRVVDGKATAKAMIIQSYQKTRGYVRCTEGFKQPPVQIPRVPEAYRLAKFRKLYRVAL